MEAHDPYKSPPPDESASASPELKPLGSLAQSARGNELKQAQWILIVIGILTVLANAFLLYNIPKEIQQAIQQELNQAGPGAQADPEQVEEFKRIVTFFGYAIYGGTLAVGVLFIIFGIIIKKFPVAITVTSLVLYVVLGLGLALLDPTTLARGIIIKVLVVVALFRAIKAARAYKEHTKKADGMVELLG